MRTFRVLSALSLTAGVLAMTERHLLADQGLPTSWDTSTSCGKAHLGCQMGVECACHYFKDCNPDGSYVGPMLSGIDKCLCENGWSAYCSGHGQFAATPLEKRDVIATVSILDEHPGHKTLNRAAATQKSVPTTAVTVVDDNGTLETLTPTTNAKGKTILATEHPHFVQHQAQQDEPDETATATLVVDYDDNTMTLRPTRSAHHVVTSTVRVVNHVDQTVVPIPRVSTVTKVVTETVTRTVDHHDRHHEMYQTATVAHIGNDRAVPITKDLQLIHNHTLVKVIPQPPEGTLVPLMWDPMYQLGWEHVMEMELHALQELYSHMDWNEVGRVAYHVRKHGDEMETELSLKYALVMLLRSSPDYRHRQSDVREHAFFVPITGDGPYASTVSMVDLGTTRFPLSKPTQTVGDHVYVNDPLNKYRMYDPWHNAAAPTGSCHSNQRNGSHHKEGEKECRVERCMWEVFMQPINITTAMPMAMYDRHGIVDVNYFTHTTEVRHPHWGVTTSKGLYYPTSRVNRLRNGTFTHEVVRATPDWLGEHHKGDHHVHGAPVCHDLESCHGFCRTHGNSRKLMRDGHFNWAWIVWPLIAALALGALCALLILLHHRRRRDEPQKETIVEKVRRKSSKGPDAIVNQASGNAVDPATGQHVDPASAVPIAVIAGSAAGAEAAKEKKDGGDQSGNNQAATGGGDEGRGTTGRRAEEGRGRVNFEDGGRPGNEGSPSGENRAPAEHTTEVKPAGQTDGTGEVFTGRQMPDMGSMRGRKRSRPEGGMGWNLGF